MYFLAAGLGLGWGAPAVAQEAVDLPLPTFGEAAFTGVDVADRSRNRTFRAGTMVQVDPLGGVALVGSAYHAGRTTFGLVVPAAAMTGPNAAVGLGDAAAHTRLTLVGSRQSPGVLGLRSAVILPTGREDDRLGEGRLRLAAGLVASVRVGPVTLATDAGVLTHRGDDEIGWGNAARFALPAASRTALTAEILARTGIRDSSPSVEAIGGLELYPGRSTTLGLGAGRSSDTDDLRVLARLVTAFERPERPPTLYSIEAPPPYRMAFGGASPGGAQDITFFRDAVEDGRVPDASAFTPEGLFSEHDLPLAPEVPCERLLCTNVKAADATLLVQEEVRWMAQIGFSSNAGADFRRPPVNLVAVVDISGSMSGPPIATVQASLLAAAEQLDAQDQLSIVVYGDAVRTHLGPTPGIERDTIARAIAAMAINGSTNMEAGLLHGFALARETRRTFDGVTRVMLFTDEQPNTGATDPGTFMSLARAASLDGIGTTTIGVGTNFGAELARDIGSVRGGNLFYFSDPDEMREKFASDFDLMVTELAYDLELTIRAAAGVEIVGVYGVPNDTFEHTEDGDLRMTVGTMFPSRERGGIFVGLAPAGHLPTTLGLGSEMLQVTLGYHARDGLAEPVTHQVVLVEPGPGDEGLPRGIALVDQATALARITTEYHQGHRATAHQLAAALRSRMQELTDPDLAPEVALVAKLDDLLATDVGVVVER